MTVSQSAQQLEGQPFLLYVFQERSRAQAVVEGVVEVLANQVAICLGFDDSLVCKGIRYVLQLLPLSYDPEPSVRPQSYVHCQRAWVAVRSPVILTKNLLPVFLQ
jgi:hypothetical protein